MSISQDGFSITGPHDTPDGEQYFLVGPDGLVWHMSGAVKLLNPKAEELNRAYELGKSYESRRKQVHRRVDRRKHREAPRVRDTGDEEEDGRGGEVVPQALHQPHCGACGKTFSSTGELAEHLKECPYARMGAAKIKDMIEETGDETCDGSRSTSTGVAGSR